MEVSCLHVDNVPDAKFSFCITLLGAMFRVVGLAPEPFFLSFFLSLVVRFVILKEEEEIQVEGILFRYLS